MERIPKSGKLGNKNTNLKYCLISKLLADLTSCFVVDILYGPVYTIKFSVIKVEIFRWEILGFEVFVRNY